MLFRGSARSLVVAAVAALAVLSIDAPLTSSADVNALAAGTVGAAGGAGAGAAGSPGPTEDGGDGVEATVVASPLAATMREQRAASGAVARSAERARPRTGAGGHPISERGLLLPVVGPVSSLFGMRMHPIYRTLKLHAGIDIKVPDGTAILAALGGRVVNAEYHSGYGNYTCVDDGVMYGHRVITCYGHQSKLLVHRGQTVRQGQLIGYSGESGSATGPHLHFEVRVDPKPLPPGTPPSPRPPILGTPVDPAPWLPRLPVLPEAHDDDPNPDSPVITRTDGD